MGKVAIITGASSGIGLAFAKLLASKGFSLILSARSEENLISAGDKIAELGANYYLFPADVGKKESSESLVKLAIEKFGRLDLFLANAGITMKGFFTDVRLEVHHKLMDSNYFGCLYAAHYSLDELMKNNGSFIAVSSIAGFKGLPGRSAYSASKHAINGLIDTLQTEYLKLPVHIMLACPGFTNTNTRKAALLADGSIQGDTPREEGKMMSPEQVATEIYKAYQLKKKRLTLTKQGRMMKLLSKFADGFLTKKIYESFAKEPDSPLPK